MPDRVLRTDRRPVRFLRGVPGSEWVSPDGAGPPHTLPVGDADYLSIWPMKIYVGGSRHWAVVWLWFLS